MSDNHYSPRVSYCTQQCSTYDFIAREQDTTKLVLIGLFLYNYEHQSLVLHDVNKAINAVKYLDIKNISAYKLMLDKKIKELVKENYDTANQLISEIQVYVKDKFDKYERLDDKQFCYYLWSVIYGLEDSYKYMNMTPTHSLSITTISKGLFFNQISQFHKWRKLIVIYYMEFSAIDDPFLVISNALQNWQSINKYNLLVDIRDHTAEQVNWDFDYLLNFAGTKKITIDNIYMLQVQDTQDKINTFYAIIDFYLFKFGLSKTFKTNYQNTLSQKKFRDNTIQKKTSISVNNELKKQLKELAKHEKMSQSSLLEKIIHDYYERNTK